MRYNLHQLIVQGYAFNFFTSRLGEFAVGMIAAVALRRNPSSFQKVLLNPWMAVLGFLIWIGGDSLIYQGFWGWVFADFVIAVGLIIWVINLGGLIQKNVSFMFAQINQLGVWSYYIFLTHYLLVFISQKLDSAVIPLVNESWIGIKVVRVSFFAGIIGGTWIATRILQRFDQSQICDLIY